MRTAIFCAVLLAAALAVGLFVRSRIVGRVALDLTPPQGEVQGPSIFEGIRDQVGRAPDKTLDLDKLPAIGPSPSGLSFAPGAADALFGSGKATTDEWKRVREAVRAINAGRLSDWRVLERNVASIAASSCVDTVLENLHRGDVTPEVKRTFWQMAKGSRSYEAVKWGIAVGSLGLREDEVADLLLLARHGEFTTYTSYALLRESKAHPELKRHLVALLPTARQWGVIRLVDYLVLDKGLVAQKDVQRDVLVYGMLNNDGIPMEVAFTIAKSVDLVTFAEEAVTNDRVFRAMVDLLETLVHDPQPLGGLAQLENWPRAYEAFVSMLEKRPASARLLVALDCLREFLEDAKLDWPRRAGELARIAKLWNERFSAEVLRRSLDLDEDRSGALRLVHAKKVRALLPDVEAIFAKKPDYLTLRILGELGGKQQLETLLARVPALVNLEARKSVPLSDKNLLGPQYQHDFEYAQIVSYLGRLATPTAVNAIKAAITDYNPEVRRAACQAVADLPPPAVDTELRTLVRARLSDSPPYVSQAARKTATHLGIPLPPSPKDASD